YSSRISLRGRSAASLRQNCVTVFSFSKNHFSSPSGRWSIVLLISSWGSTLYHCANSSINFSVTDTNSSRTSEAALWPSTYISPLSNSTPCIRKDRISSKSLMRLSICFPKHLFQVYLNIYNNYFKAPWMPDRTEANPNELNQDDARYGFRCCHLKNIWTAPLPPETELSRQMTTSTTSIDIMGLQAAYANLQT